MENQIFILQEMNVAIFTNAYRPMVSGVVNAIELIRQGLLDRGHQVYIVAPRYNGFRDEYRWTFRYPSVRLTPGVDFPLAIPFHPFLSARLRKLPIDIVHTQHPFLLGNTGARLARQRRIPLVFTFHTRYDQYVHYAPFAVPAPVSRYLVRRMVSSYVRKCSAVVVPSPSIRDLVENHGGGDRCHIIPNAISLAPFQTGNGAAIRQEHGLLNKKVLLFVGRLAQEKNLSFLLEAYARALPSLPDSRLLLVGDGPYRKALEKEAHGKGLGRQVIFTGLITPREVPGYLAAADLFVMTSTTEVRPLALLESMAAGLPVLAVRAPGPVDTITHGEDGWLTAENREEFSQALIYLLGRQEEVLRLSQNARKTAEHYGLSAMAQKLEKLYDGLLERHCLERKR